MHRAPSLFHALAVPAVVALLTLACAGGGPAPTSPAGDAAATRGVEEAVYPEDPTVPPMARTERQETMLHGITLVDDYGWLRDREDPRVIAYLEAENRHAEAVLAHTGELQEQLYQEMRGRIKETDLSVPARIDDYYYYHRTEEGQQYRIYCRKRGSLAAEEEVLLDGNALAEGHDYFSLGVYEVSPDHRLLAYGTDFEGAETFTIHVKDLTSGELLADEIPGASYGFAWGNDNRTLFYTTYDEAHRPYQLRRHVLGQDPSQDELLYTEEDDSFFLWVHKTKSRRFLLMSLGSSTTSEVWYLDADRPGGAFQRFAPRSHEVETYLDHHGRHFYVLTNEDAKNFRLLRTPVDDVSREAWEEVVPHREEVKLSSIELFRDHMVLFERRGGLTRVRVRELANGEDHAVSFPEPIYAVWPGDNPEFDTRTFRFRYTSLVTPMSIFDYDLAERTRELKKQTEVLGGYDPGRYTTERIWARAADGTEIPISLVYPKGLTRDGSNPCLLYGYGSYGVSVDPSFSSDRLSLLERGFVYAMAHVRGGGELGEAWHDAGKLMAKRNTFTDFIAAAEHLIAEGYTSRELLTTTGGSAGGLLMGAVLNMRPDLFQAALARVPFVDIMNTMLDPTIPLTVIEYEEWGNPNEPEAFKYMLSYSPYDNVRAQEYPHLLITAGLNDPRVGYWEPAKWTARLRVAKTDGNRLLLKTNMGAGHGGASGRFDALREKAFNYAFLLDAVGLAE